MSNDFKSVLEVRTEVRDSGGFSSLKATVKVWIVSWVSYVSFAEPEAAAQQERTVLPASRLIFSPDGQQLQ